MAQLDLDRIKGNVAKMAAQGAPAEDIDGYIASEGATVEAVRSHKLRQAEKPKRPDTSGTLDPVTETLLSGMTLGLSDEAAGAGRYVARGIGNTVQRLFGGEPTKTAAQAYEEGKNATRENVRQFSEDNPVTAGALQIVGGMAGALPAKGFMAAPTLAGRMGQGAGAGGTIGAIAGAGGADGGLEDRLLGAGQGATLGAGIGAALPAITQGVAAGARHAGNMFGMRPAETVANEKLAVALARDNLTPEQLLAEVQRRQSLTGKPETLMDVGGEAMRRTARTAMSRPGEASSRGVVALTERQAAQPERIAQDLQRVSPNSDFYGSMGGLARQRSAQAQPLYRQAFDDPAPVWNERIQQFIDSPEAKQGLRQGLTIQRREALARGEPFDPKSYGVTGFNEAGDPIVSGTPNLRSLDAIKRGIDDMLEAYRDKTTGKLVLDEAGRALEAVRKSFVGEIDRAAPPVYREARAAWSGPSQSRNAMEAGRDFLKMDPEQIASRLKGMAPADQDFFRAGAKRALVDTLSKTADNADAVRRIFGTPGMRSKIEAVFPNKQEFQAFELAMKREAEMLRNARFVSPNTGSQTFLRQMEAADAAPNPIMEAIAGVVQGESPKKALLGALAGRAVSRVGGYTPDVANRLVDTLLSTDPAAQRQALQGLLGFQAHSPRTGLLGARARAGMLTGGGGLLGNRD